MQVPPEQPMGPGGYPRPDNYGQPEKFTMDMVMGIILIILAALGACGSLALVGIGGLGAAVGTSASGQQGAGAVTAAGGLVMVLGIFYLLACVAYIVGAVGMIGSKKSGLNLVMIVGVVLLILGIVLGAVTGSFNIVGVLIGLIFPGYCAARLFGNFGPRPL